MSNGTGTPTVAKEEGGTVTNRFTLASNQLPVDTKWLFPEYDFEAKVPSQYFGVSRTSSPPNLRLGLTSG